MPAPARWAARAARWAAPVMPGDPAATHDRGPPLVGVGAGGARAPTRATSAPLDAGRPGRRETSSPMSATHDLAGEGPAAVEQQPRLERRERDRADRLRPAPAGHRPGQPVDPARDVDGQHGRAGGVGRAVLAVEPGAVRRVDHQVAGRQRSGRLGRRRSRPCDAAPLAAGGRPRGRRCRCCPCRRPRPPAARRRRPAGRAPGGPRPRRPARSAPRPARARRRRPRAISSGVRTGSIPRRG